jgi:hypothetical protein
MLLPAAARGARAGDRDHPSYRTTRRYERGQTGVIGISDLAASQVFS